MQNHSLTRMGLLYGKYIANDDLVGTTGTLMHGAAGFGG
jgi:hypothetical protein